MIFLSSTTFLLPSKLVNSYHSRITLLYYLIIHVASLFKRELTQLFSLLSLYIESINLKSSLLPTLQPCLPPHTVRVLY